MSGQRARVPSRQALLAERFLDPERGQPQPRLLLGPLGPLRGWAVAGWGMPPLGAQWRRPAELSPTPWSPDDAPKVSSEWGWKGPDAGPRPAVGGRASGPPRSRALRGGLRPAATTWTGRVRASAGGAHQVRRLREVCLQGRRRRGRALRWPSAWAPGGGSGSCHRKRRGWRGFGIRALTPTRPVQTRGGAPEMHSRSRTVLKI